MEGNSQTKTWQITANIIECDFDNGNWGREGDASGLVFDWHSLSVLSVRKCTFIWKYQGSSLSGFFQVKSGSLTSLVESVFDLNSTQESYILEVTSSEVEIQDGCKFWSESAEDVKNGISLYTTSALIEDTEFQRLRKAVDLTRVEYLNFSSVRFTDCLSRAIDGAVQFGAVVRNCVFSELERNSHEPYISISGGSGWNFTGCCFGRKSDSYGILCHSNIVVRFDNSNCVEWENISAFVGGEYNFGGDGTIFSCVNCTHSWRPPVPSATPSPSESPVPESSDMTTESDSRTGIESPATASSELMIEVESHSPGHEGAGSYASAAATEEVNHTELTNETVSDMLVPAKTKSESQTATLALEAGTNASIAGGDPGNATVDEGSETGWLVTFILLTVLLIVLSVIVTYKEQQRKEYERKKAQEKADRAAAGTGGVHVSTSIVNVGSATTASLDGGTTTTQEGESALEKQESVGFLEDNREDGERKVPDVPFFDIGLPSTEP
jgi:hypothetical protein